MPSYASWNGSVKMSKEAWESVKDISLDPEHEDLVSSFEHLSDDATIEYEEESGKVTFNVYGSNVYDRINNLLNLLAAAKDVDTVDILDSVYHDENAQGCIFIWPGDWEGHDLVPPPIPNLSERRYIENQAGGRLIIKDGKTDRTMEPREGTEKVKDGRLMRSGVPARSKKKGKS